MAKYKISLLTPVSDNNLSRFMPTELGSYNNQINYEHTYTYFDEIKQQETIKNAQALTAHANHEQPFCYTYNEKYSQHQNSQKELTFSMDRNILLHDEWMHNPYVAAIHVGSIIELQDKYDNTVLFIVKKIGYSFKEHNITYNYTCQDAFSYQYTRQQSGYTIENDSSSDTFIGPKTIDWWVVRKIVPECYIKYEYIPLQVGLYRNNDTGNIYRFTNQERERWQPEYKKDENGNYIKDENGNDILINTKTIIKEPFDNEEFQTPITFSCSGSNANAALIALGDNLELMIHTYEGRNVDGTYYQFFWYEPKQNQDVTGLKYSPKTQISKFSLDFAGDSLTTVLNVNSHQVGDELITLIPQTPAIFTNYFMTKDWEKPFYPGYFTDIINGKTYKQSYELAEQNDNNISINVINEIQHFKDNITGREGNFVAIQLKDNDESDIFTLPLLYNRFADNWETNRYTEFSCYFNDANIPKDFTGANNHIYLIIVENKYDEKGQKITHIIHEDEEIPQYLVGTPNNIYLGLRTSQTGKVLIQNINIFIRFYRLFTKEEKSFATIADQCPWLENRLIDFTYFLQQGIISRQEYETLMYKLQNDLRIVNGKLLFLTDSYHRAIKTKTKILADLTNKLEALSAAFHADVVSKLEDGKQPEDISSFLSSYTTVFNLDQNLTQLLDYNNVVNDYFEKYLSAEQRFLENIYAFRKYFDEPCTFSYDANAGIYKYTLTSDLNGAGNFITFGEPHFIPLSDSNNLTQWFYNDNGHYIIPNLVTPARQEEFYKPNIAANDFVRVDTDGTNFDESIYDYVKTNSYWIRKDAYDIYFKSLARKEIEKYTYNDIIYVKLTATELKRLILAANPKKYYLRDKDTYTYLDDVRKDSKTISNAISWITLPNFLKYWDTEGDLGKKCTNICDWNLDKDDFYWNYYKAFFPLSNIYYKGPIIRSHSEISYDDKNKEHKKWVLESIDEKGNVNAETTYQAYQPIPFAGNGSVLKDWGPCANDEAVLAKNNINKAWNYAAFNYSPSGASIAHEVTSGLLGFGLYSIGSSLWHAFLDEKWCKWKNNLKSFRAFEGKGETMHERVNGIIPADFAATIVDKIPDYYKYDSYYANFATSVDAADQHIIQTRLWYKRTGAAPKSYEPQITWQEQGVSDPIDFTKLSTKISYNLNEYFNFYRYIVPTYSFRFGHANADDLPLFVKNKYFRILSGDDYLNGRDSYIRIPVYSNTKAIETTIEYTEDTNAKATLQDHTRWIYIKDPSLFRDNSALFSAITWYPLYNLGEDIKLTSYKNLTNKPIKLKDFVKETNKGYSIDINNRLVNLTTGANNGNSAQFQYLYAHIEDYTRAVFGKEKDINDKVIYAVDDEYGHSAIKILNTIYDIETDAEVNLLKIPNVLKSLKTLNNNNCDLHMISASDDNMVHLTPSDKNDESDKCDNIRCYQRVVKDDGSYGYERAYTKKQVLDAIKNNSSSPFIDIDIAKRFAVIGNTSIELINFTNNIKTFNPNIFLCSIKDNGTEYKIDVKRYNGDNTLDFSDANSKLFTFYDENNESYTSTITLKEKKEESLSNISNGTFWYRYHDHIEWPTLFEYAAAIETQLQTYWNQAYTASKYCKYFLPQYWQPQTGSVKNEFAADIIVPIIENDKVIGVTLSNTYLPEVDIYINDDYETFKYKHYLTKYLWRFNPQNKNTWNELCVNEDIVSSQDNNNYINAATVPILADNKGILDIVTHLGTKLSDWEVVENGYTIYYYNCGENTGRLWSELASKAMGASTFEHFDGLYGMMYYILKNSYAARSMQEYESAKQLKESIWNQIYTEYPFLMLEDNYKYELATTSEELLKMSQLVFKGKKQPEKGYSVSMIDIHSLTGYIGQELKPGQGILLDASEYYDEYDDLYTALSQYLFITDVSYSLRSDADISITVNSIKYQEKLLQSLVKLIR